MSDFSSKCREYLTDTGETVYQLASSSGLDRTSLQRMLTGKRLPSIDFIHQFCDSIRINPSQRLELMELYKIEKIGKEVYYNRKYIQELLRVISSQQTISPSGFQRLPSLPFYRGDFSFDVEKISLIPALMKKSVLISRLTAAFLYRLLHAFIQNTGSFLL